MHMNLHPDDIKEILEKGWGQRHPMAWTGWVYTPVPSTFVMVYAPRGRLTSHIEVMFREVMLTQFADENDLRIACKIIEAAIWYTASEKVDIEGLLDA
jgi:hypothetical protein